MGTPLSVLIVEDSAIDAGLMVRQLQKEGFDVVHRRVEAAAEMGDALRTDTWNVVLSDFNVPGFGAVPALALLRESKLDIPFIVVSGVIGEEAAVGIMRDGAQDCLMKSQPGRLAPAVKREVAEARDRLSHRKADEALRASEERFRNLLRDAPSIAVQGYGMDGITRYWNQASERLYGYTAQEAVGRSLLDLIIPPEMRPDVAQAIRHMSETGESIPASELSLQRKDGSRVAVFSSHAIVRAPGQAPELFCIDVDLTETRKADLKLRESETRYRSLFENMLNGFAYCRMEYDDRDRPVDFVYLEVNKSFERLTGMTDVEGRKVSELIPGIRELSPEVFETYGRVARAGHPETFELDFKPLGKWLTVSVYSPAKDHFIALFDDITARKNAESALRESEKKYRRIYDSLQDVYLETDMNGTILDISPKIEVMFNSQYTREELLGKQAGDFYADPKRREALMLVLKQHGQVVDFEVDLRNRDGSIVPCSLSTALSRNADGVPIGIVSTMRDISARRRAERDLVEANEQFQAVVEQSIAGILIIQDRRIAYVNPRFGEIHGYPSQQELAGTDPLAMVAAADRPVVADIARRLLGGEMDRLSHTLNGLRKDGSTIELGVESARATFHGRPAIIAIMQDISEKKRAEERIQRYVAQLQRAFMSTVEVATIISEMRDPYTAGHERRVAEIAVAIGAELGFDDQRLEGLRVGGFLHDLGKITIPAEILSKPGRLKPIELELIRGHSQASYDVLKNVDFPWPVAQMALQHHERVDGSGYPRGLEGDAILLEARILGVADTVEAMSSHRPYRAALGIASALGELERGRGSTYDPSVVDACLRLFREKGYSIPA
jgi:PAS domain S-box-containing protein